MNLLNKYDLIDAAKSNSIIFKRILKECLDVKDEELLIIGDEGYEDRHIAALMATSYYIAAKELKLKANLIMQKPKFRGDSADEKVIEALDNLKEGSVITLSLSNKLGSIKDLGRSYRKFVKSRNHRFASTPTTGRLTNEQFYILANSINIDYNALKEKAEIIKQKLDDGKELHVTSPAGTDMYMNIKGKTTIKNTGNYQAPATGGNIPAGEVYLPPFGKKYINGKIVIDATLSYRGGSTLVKKPVTMVVEKGKVVDITGGKEADILKATLDWAEQKAKHPWGVRRIGELGIGLNPSAKLVGATILDEKVLNTAHFAIGSNYWFGGTIYAIIHLDQVFRNPSIYVDGDELKV
jgi:leucyl aminopeptidase (aminopeptidase T)